jgi:trimeric autotransporter adhesin
MIRAKTDVQARSKALAIGLVLAALMALSLMGTAKPAHARDFTVINTNDSGAGSLRQAITDANNTPGADVIRFDIPGSGVKSIKPASQLPGIREEVTIDGYTQPGSKKNTLAKGTNAVPLIELDASNAASGTDGLVIRDGASNSEIRGLVINRFNDGVVVSGGIESEITGVEIEGNFIGTDATGQGDLGNRGVGVVVFSFVPNSVTDNTIGGAEPEARNLISGNGGNGTVFGDGVSIHRAENNKVEGNLIGTKKDGTSPLGNEGDGVSIFATSGNSVGGPLPGAANTIAFNVGNGVVVNDVISAGNPILGNSIFSNERLGIDLGGLITADGRTANDPKDPDAGPNTLQNFPVVGSAKPFKKKKRKLSAIAGSLNSTPNQTFIVELFSSPSGTDEGKTFIGQRSVTTDFSGGASFTITVRRSVAPVGSAITATATDSGGNTSEFSEPVTVG